LFGNFPINSIFKTTMDFQAGQLLLINKSKHWTSFDVVKKIKYLIRKKYGFKKIKVGHAGTLDPLATGLLVVCTGKSTKTIQELQAKEKEYIAKIKLGATTPSFDLETEINEQFEVEHITKELICNTLKKFEGDILQDPPIYSAKNINGERAYNLARRGEKVELKAKKIHIEKIEYISYDSAVLTIKIHCSSGTYIRSLANDLGYAMQSGAHLIELIRTKIGIFNIEESVDIKEFEENLKLL